MPDEFVFIGDYRTGSGRASVVFNSQHRKSFMIELFGCPMVGTFNITCARPTRKFIKNITPSIVGLDGDTAWSFRLCKIRAKNNEERYGWIIYWSNNDRQTHTPYKEVITRSLLPDSFKTKELTVTVLEKWGGQAIRGFIGSYDKWFQSFSWGIKRAGSELVWNAIKPLTAWSGKRVLDVGCNTGYFSFRAAQSGSIVKAVDINNAVLNIARKINDHVEMQDVVFTDKDDGGRYDIILYLSVHHQRDPKYDNLKQKIDELRGRCSDLFVELIVPPLEGLLQPQDVNNIVGVNHLLEYKHVVRRVRRIYHIKN
jgi:hypothetical protein